MQAPILKKSETIVSASFTSGSFLMVPLLIIFGAWETLKPEGVRFKVLDFAEAVPDEFSLF